MRRSDAEKIILNLLEAIVDRAVNKKEDWSLDVHASNILANLEHAGMVPPERVTLLPVTLVTTQNGVTTYSQGSKSGMANEWEPEDEKI